MHSNIQHFYDDQTTHCSALSQGHCDVMTTSCPDTPPSLHQHQQHDHQYHLPFKHRLLATIDATTTAAALPPTTHHSNSSKKAQHLS
jgi:hypothetical protein